MFGEPLYVFENIPENAIDFVEGSAMSCRAGLLLNAKVAKQRGDVRDRCQWQRKGALRRSRNTMIDEGACNPKPEPMLQLEIAIFPR